MADRYWVGGAATWNATAGTKWAATSGGAGGEAVPTSADDVYFDAASGAVAVVIGTGSTCKNLTFTGFTGSLGAGTGALSCYGNLTMTSVTSGWTGTISFLSTTAQTITSNGFTFDNGMNFNGVGGSWQLQDNLTTGSTRIVTLTNGALDLNSKTLSCGLFGSSNSNTRSIAFGTGNITVTGSGATIWSCGTSTGISYTGTPIVNATYSGSTGTRTITTGGVGLSETNCVSFNINAGSDAIALGSSTSSIKSLNFTGFSGTLGNYTTVIYGDLTYSTGMTLTAGSNATFFFGTLSPQNITTNSKTLDFPLTFNGIGGTFAFADALTQGSTRAFTVTNGTVKLKAGAMSTVGSFITSGTNQKYLQSTTPGTQATISDASGVNSVSYLTISDSFATGGATWDAFYSNGNIDAGNNTNWDFGATPVLGAEYEYKLRSFTEPRRF